MNEITEIAMFRDGAPCQCGERREKMDTALALWCCIQCGTPAGTDQPDTALQHALREKFRRAQAIIMHGSVPLETLAQRVALAWSDVIDPRFGVELARASVTPLACPPDEGMPLRQLVVDVLQQRKRTWGLCLADAMILQLAERAERVRDANAPIAVQSPESSADAARALALDVLSGFTEAERAELIERYTRAPNGSRVSKAVAVLCALDSPMPRGHVR